MKRIAFIHNRFPAGGAERITIDIARYLSGFDGYEVYIYASRISEDMIADDDRSRMVLRHVPLRRTAVIVRHIRNDKIDVLVQVGKSLPDIDEIKAKTGVMTVVAFHGEPFCQRYAIMSRRQNGFFRKMLWHLYNRKRYEDGTLAMTKAVSRTRRDYESCDAYTVLCEPYRIEIEDRLGVKHDESHIHVIENPEHPVADIRYDKENIVLFCGRFENWSKRIDRLFRIWKMVQDKMQDWKLVLVGSGKDWRMLTGMAQDMELERVSFEGFRTDVGEYYRRASVVVLTSETEGWPLALTEAQAQGCITIAFDCSSGVREVLGHEEGCGIAVPSFDEELFAEELLGITAMDSEEELRMRRNAVSRRGMYVPDIISEKWRCLFDELCNEIR